MALTVGQPAPEFTLHDTEKNEVSLKSLQGKNVLLLFFPLAFTGTCTKELCSIRDNIALYNDVNATVFGVSVDAPPTLAKFKEEQHLNFSLLSDFNKEASAAYDTLYASLGWMKGVSKRSAFVIDKQGVLRYQEILETATDLPDFDAIRHILNTLK